MPFSPQEYARALARRRGMGSPQSDALRAQADMLAATGVDANLLMANSLRQQADALDTPVSQVTVTPTGLSTGAKVGLGLAGAGLASGLAYALWPKKRRRRR